MTPRTHAKKLQAPRRAPRSGPGWSPLRRVAQAAQRRVTAFMHIQASSGIVLLAATLIALILANSPWNATYRHVLGLPLGVHLGGLAFERSLGWFVNDGLMVIFFFVVGLEIRREIHQGELSEWSRAALPVAAALGGVVLPAVLYLAIAREPAVRPGWGVPMATDIAFALGILSLLGRRIPSSLRVLLLALAVIDDLAAILVIALFYSAGIALEGCLVALLGFLGVVVLRAFGVRRKFAYFLPAIVAWAGVYAAGVHPTIAGVILGFMTPIEPYPPAEDDESAGEPKSPSQELIDGLHPWVAFMIMPLFALANAGVTLTGFSLDALSASLVKGTVVGLLLGKPIGIGLAVALMLALGIGKLPSGLGKRHVLVLGTVAGIGFTMSLFVAELAFEDAKLLGAAKLGVLLASGAACVLALVIGRFALRSEP
jgi:NhaA family Na+:H+ antiporter